MAAPPLFVLILIFIVARSIFGGDGGASESTTRFITTVPLHQQGELAQRFRPYLLFDGAERWRPLNVDRFFRDAARQQPLELCELDPGRCLEIHDVDQFQHLVDANSGLGQGSFMDVPGTQPNGSDYASADPACRSQGSPVVDCDTGRDSAIYYNVTAANSRFYIDYWWFFRYNDFPPVANVNLTSCTSGPLRQTAACDDHEGDWEGVTVVTPIADPTTIEYVSFAAHTGTYRYLPGQLDLRGETGTRPAVYAANGSHASYSHACDSELVCGQNSSSVLGLPDGRYNGAAPWGRNSGDACNIEGDPCLRHLPNELVRGRASWDGYRGQWGKACPQRSESCPLATGPRSPTQQPRYQTPWCSTVALSSGNKVESHRTCDESVAEPSAAEVPGVATAADCLTWLGVGVAALACDRDTLAHTLSAKDAEVPAQVHLTRKRPAGETQRAPASTPGVAQLQGEPLSPRQTLVATGPISDLTIRFTGSASGHGRPRVYEAEFHDLPFGAGGHAVAQVRDRVDRPPAITVRLPSGERLRGVVHPL